MQVKTQNQDQQSLLQNYNHVLISSQDLSNDKLVAEGKVCNVYSFHHKYYGNVVVKRLKEDILTVPLIHGNMMRREAKCLEMLIHPNIVLFIGMVWEPNFHAIVMEYLINGDLQTFIERYRLHTYVKVKLFCDVAQGLNYLHWLPKRIIHNYLKAANILIAQDIVAKVSDFSLADWTSFTTDLFYENNEKRTTWCHKNSSKSRMLVKNTRKYPKK